MERFRELLPEVRVTDEEELILLGAPILATSIEIVLRRKLQDLQLMVERLESLDAHDAWFLLKHCLAIPRLMYTLRCSPCYEQRAVLEEYDHQLKIGLESILNLTLEGQPWQQCVLPFKDGGLGVRLATELALPAFLASAHATETGVSELLPEYVLDKTYIDLENAESSWGDMLPDGTLQPMNKSVQANWDIPLYERRYQELELRETNPIDVARLRAVSGAHSSDWLNAMPIPGLGLKMDDAHFRIACGLRLGLSMCRPYTCVCGELVDTFARHGLSCRITKGRGPRHSQLNDQISRALTTALVPNQREPPGLVMGDMKRPDGMSLIPWKNGKYLAWDITCNDTLATTYVTMTSVTAGGLANWSEDRKLEHYKDLGDRYIMTPIAIETMGSWGQISLEFIKELGARLTRVNKDRRSTSYLFQALSMITQKGNAASILGTIPKAEELEEIYYLVG